MGNGHHQKGTYMGTIKKSIHETELYYYVQENPHSSVPGPDPLLTHWPQLASVIS